MTPLPLSNSELESIAQKYSTPFHIYDEKLIRQRARELFASARKHFPNFQEFFAVKALPNPKIIQILKEEGCGVDCSSIPELWIAERLGFPANKIMFSSNYTQEKEFAFAHKLGAIINLDDITLFKPFLKTAPKLPELVCFRYNPGDTKSDGNFMIGKPSESKYGLTKNQMLEAYVMAQKAGIKRFGMHAMTGTNILEEDYFIETAELILELAGEVHKKLDINFEFINIGGSLGIPYKPDDEALDTDKIFSRIRKVFDEKITQYSMPEPNLYMESGRWMTGPFGWLVARVVSRKDTFKKYVGLDASMANLMRPALYDAYHKITIPKAEQEKRKREVVNVVGPLCENNDQFAKNREIPEAKIGDLVVIHNTGAHGWAMGFQYNGRLRSAEILLKENGETELIRRHETVEDYFRTALDVLDI